MSTWTSSPHSNWHARISPNLVIIAVCARPYVAAAAQAGYNVAAFDIFNDVETRRLSFISEQVRFCNGGFEAEDLWQKLIVNVPSDTAVAYGSGLENQPEVLEKIASRFRLTGNSPETVASSKHPDRFFALLDALNVPHPETRLDAPSEDGWVAKKMGGSGGTHIRLHENERSGDYYQRLVAGTPISVLFLADGQNVEVVGYNEQWVAPTTSMPFRYGGIVCNVELQYSVKITMAEAASRVARALGLRGLNSMDFILSAEGELSALEVNPRLSASFDLYNIPDLFERHLQGCRGEMASLPQRASGSKAMLVYYASRDIDVPVMEWPSWTVDRPVSGTRCLSGDPVCTIVAQAYDALSAKALVFARARELDAQLQTLQKIPGK